MARKHYLIIGDGAAGTTAAQHLRANDPKCALTIFSDDPHAAYFRAALTNYLLGELREEQIWAVPPTFYADVQVNRVLARVAGVDTARSQLWLAQGGAAIPYDGLVLAAGSRANAPRFEGAWLPGVMTMRTLQDVRRVMDLIKLRGMQRAVVIGGGPLALEWAHGLNHRGVKVTMFVREPKFLPGRLDAVGSDLLLARLRQGGVDVRMADEIVAAVPGRDGRVAAAVTKNREQIPCELVAAAIGVTCNSDFLRSSGIELTKNGGVLTDETMRTSAPNVYAAGDIAAVKGSLMQLWEPARVQGRAAAMNMTGAARPPATYAPGAFYMATRLYDLDLAAVGDVAKAPPGARDIVDFPQRTGRISYRRLSIVQGKLAGALLFGEKREKVRQRGRLYKQLIDEQIDVSAIENDLLDPGFDLHGWLQANTVMAKPREEPRAQQKTLASPGRMRGTQALRLSDLPPMSALGASGPVSNPASIAAPAPSSAPANPGAPPAAVAKGSAGTQAIVARAPVEMARVALEGPGGRIEIQGASATLGSDPSCAVRVADAHASHVHAQISRYGADVYVRDLGSHGGTWVNGVPVSAPIRLKNGDSVRIGVTTFVVRIEGASGPASQVAPSAMEMSADGRPHFEVRSGQSLGLSFALSETTSTIGSDPSSSIRLDDPSVSARHAFLKMHGPEWLIADAQSHAGTRRNGQPIAPGQWVQLQEGDVVQIGEVLLVYTTKALRAAMPRSQSTAPPAAGPPPQAYPSAAPPSRLPRARISVRSANGPGTVAELAEKTLVGSQPGACQIVVHDPMVAPQHVEIVRAGDGGYYVRDLGTRTGTQIRGQRLGPAPLRLTSGDVIVLGQSALLFEATS